MTTSGASFSISVTGMTCEGCANTVRGALLETPGVAAVDVDVASGRVVVRAADGADVDDLAFDVDDAVVRAGYGTA